MIDPADLQAKSDQMNAVDFVKPMVFRIVRVEYNPRQEQPIKLHFDGHDGRPYKPCKSMLRGLVRVWGDDETQWNNKLIELFCDPSVKWAGKDAGGIRIKAISGIAEPFELVVQLNRKQREIQTWDAIPDDAPVEKQFILTHYQNDIEEAKDSATLDAIVQTVKVEYDAEALGKIKEHVIKARERLARVGAGEPSA